MHRHLLFAALACFLTAGLAHGRDELLTDADENGKWILAPDGGEARISGRDARYPELILDLQKVKRGPVKLQVETDARYFYVKPGRKRIKLNVNALRHELTLDTQGTIKLDGETDEDWTQDWKDGLEKQDVQDITLRFSRCDYVKVTWRQTLRPVDPIDPIDPVGPADPTGDPADAIGDDPAPAEAPALGGEVIGDKAKGAVVQLRVYRENEHIATDGMATIIDPTGLAVANLHVVEGARRVEAILAGVDEPIEVTPAGFDADLDLVLLQLSRANPMARATMAPLDLVPQAPGPQDKLWLVGMERGRHQFDAAKALGAAAYTDLDDKLRKSIGHGALSKWVIVEDRVSASMAGGAALDAQGRLVGIPTWSWRGDKDASLILSSTHFGRLIEDRPIDPPTWEQLNAKLADTQLPRTTFPTLAVDADQASRDVQRFTLMVDNGHECDLCKGETVLTKRVLAGYKRTAGLKVPIYHQESYVCPRCEGTGLDPQQQLNGQLSALADAVSRADMSDERMNHVLDATRDLIREMGHHHFRSLQIMLNSQAKQQVSAGSRKVGQPLMLAGELVRRVEVPGMTRPVMGIKLSVGDDDDGGGGYRSRARKGETKMLLVDPVFTDRGSGKLALVTGVLAGYVRIDPDESPVAVVSRVMVVPIDEDKIIVRKTAEELNKEREAEREERRKEYEERQREIERRERERDRKRRDNNRRY